MTSLASRCDCCVGPTDRTPLAVENRPGLAAVAYRTGTHGDFLASMVAALTDAGRPGLAALSTRDDDDFTIALLDAYAMVSDVLSFYNERLAQESYLRTAVERTSVQELARLIGYRLRPGVAAQDHLAFAVEAAPDLPPSPEPGATPPLTPAVVRVEVGVRVRSVPGPGEQPQTFETVEAIDARPEWNAIPVAATMPAAPKRDDHEVWLRGAALNLKVGDAILLLGTDVSGERWDLRVLTAVERDAVGDRTRVVFDEPLGSRWPAKDPASAPAVNLLRKRLEVFGANAPMWQTVAGTIGASYPGGDGARQWPDFTITGAASGTAVDVAGSHPDVVAGSWVVLAVPGYREAWQVTHVQELSRAEFGIAGKVTRLHLTGGENYELFRDEVRRTTVHAAALPLELADPPDTTWVAGTFVDVALDVSGLAAGRTVVVRGPVEGGGEHAEVGTVEGVEQRDGRWRIALVAPLSARYERAATVVHANVALATHGETVSEVLGSGSALASFQRFALAHEPMTRIRSTAEAGGVANALEVRVNDVGWHEAPTLYGRSPGDRSYAVREDEAGRTVVVFGDGRSGSRLPTGSHNVRARYRVGLGAAGNVGAGALSQLLDRPLGLKGVTNPLPARGGVDPEGIDAARATAPLAVRTLGRAVSLLDYEDFALAYVGITKAHAAVLPLRGGRAIVVTVATDDDTAALEELGDALRRHGDPHVRVEVVPYRSQPFRLALRVVSHPDHESAQVLAGVQAALAAAFAFTPRMFGAPVHRSQVVSVVHTVPGVAGVDVDRLYAGASPSPAPRLAAQQPGVDRSGNAVPAGLLVLTDGPLDWLEPMT